MLKASKADKEALEDGDINSILFASAGSGGGGSGGGAGPSKSSSSGADSGGNREVTFKSKARLKSVPKLDVETSTSVWEVINFISNFEIKMRSHKVSEGDQKIYLLEALKPGVVRALDMRGVDNSSMDELFEEVRRKVLGYNYLNLILDDWQKVFQKEEERVVDFKVRVCTYLRALGIDVVRKPEDQKRIIAELRKKFRKTLVEVFEGGGRNILDISWVTLWKELETLESSFFYLQHLKLLKIQAASQPFSRGDGGGKGKNRGSAAERGKGQGRGRGGGDSGQTIHCFRCGQGGHMANACNHPKVKDIPKNADGTWPRICHHCFKAGHLRSKCPDMGRKPAAAGGSYYVEVCSQDLGWVGAANLPEEDLLGEEGVSQEEILNFWRGDGGGDAKQESGDFCGWVGEISTPIILLKDRLIGGERGEEFLEGEKEGSSFSSPEIPRGGNEEGENFVGMVEGKREISSSPSEGENFVGPVEGKREISSSPSEGENFVGMVEGKREISFSPPGGESSDRGGDFSKEEFSPTTERGGSEEEGSSLGKELPELSGGEGSPHSEAALRRVRVAEAEALRRAKGRTPQAPLIPYFLTAGGQEIVGLLDMGSSHFLVKKEIFEKMEGKEVVAPTSYKGVEGGVVQQHDFIGKLRVSERGYCFILIMVCVMTRFVFLKPLRTKSAKEVAFALVNVFANFGVPQILQSDNEQVMVADVLEELRKLGGFQLRRIMKYFPRQNGVVERFVQETKQVLLKWAKGDFSGWEYYIPAIQMGLNDRIISRHRSRPFLVMFGRRMNKFENFEGVELANDLDEGELVKKAQEWGSKLWEILAKEGGEKGDRDCEATNNKKSGSRTCQTLKVGDWVVREVQKRNSKLGERWEGPYEVKGFDEERGGYSLQEMDGRLLKDLSPIEHLKVVEKALDEEQAYEVEKIVGHRGGVNDREYQIKWKGYDELSWEWREMFNEVKIIEDYWSKLKKQGGNKGPKGKEKE